MQNIAVQAAPDGKDIVTPITYDGFGRQDKNYLPYAAGGDTSGSYRSDAINPTTYTSSAQYQFYQQTTDASIPVIPNPYSQTVFEASPLNRPLQLANPGSSWAVGSGHTVNTDYEVNVASEVRLWNITTDANGNNSGATGSGYYAAGELYKTITTDENGHQVIEFKDKEGQVVCKKVQSGAAGTFVTTQYIYDDFGDLAYVLPPALSSITSFTELATDANFSNYIYAYHYDERRRMVEKKIPGKGWGYMVYDKGDRLVATQDTLQRASGYWA
ncbi:MAG TPA: DUF6443 domain-containing protein, partial [Dongiaceae bacterium]|nr:DUF6443 domain-containing protein [Dongiaceae bacterium]